MSASVEFLLRLVECAQPAPVCAEDLAGGHGRLLHACQDLGFLSRDPVAPDVPACPVCVEGAPGELAGRLRCSRCRSLLEPAGQRTWRFDPAGFLAWLAEALRLRGGVRQVESHLWHLGVWGKGGAAAECFYQRPGELSPLGRSRLEAYQSVVVLHGLTPLSGAVPAGLRRLPLSRLLVWDGTSLSMGSIQESLDGVPVRFDPLNGGLWVGTRKLGEVPVGSQESHLLACLAESLDHYVAYADLRREVLRRTGRDDARDEATYCHEIKRRIKRNFIPDIDLVLTTNNKATGYRMSAYPTLGLAR